MSTKVNDLQPRKYKIQVNDKEYTCKPMKMSHKLGIKRIEPFFAALQNAAADKPITLSTREMSELEDELAFIVSDLVIELNENDIDAEFGAELLAAMFDNDITDDTKKIKDAGVEGKDPKVTSSTEKGS